MHTGLFATAENDGQTTMGKDKASVQLLIENQSQSYGASPAIWDHTVLLATGQVKEGAPP